jgi:aldose 1-epimerase
MSTVAREDGTGELLTFSTPRASIVIDPADGGRLTSLQIDGVEVIGASTPAPGAPPQIFSGSFLMAPWVGRTAHGRFSFDGVDYEVPVNFGQHAMHGLAFDRVWRREGDDIVVDFDERWPFGGSLRQSFTLTDTSLTITATAFNEERRMPVILGFHPWFREVLDDGSTSSYEFSPGTRYVCDAEGIPIGTEPGGGPHPWDDSFTDLDSDPVVRWSNGLELTLARTGSHWILCETMPDAFCVEPLSGPVNGLATGETAVAAPGSPVSLDLTISWSTPSGVGGTITGKAS